MNNRVALSVLLLTLANAAQANASTPKLRWMAYKSNILNLVVTVPADWQPLKSPKALAFRYADVAGGSAGMGIMKSDQIGASIEQAADSEFEHAGRPSDWVRSPATVDGRRAIKMVGLDPQTPDRKIVHYYIEAPQGVYLVQCQASANHWPLFSPIFTVILTKLKFL